MSAEINDFFTSACLDSFKLNFSTWLRSLLIHYPLSPPSLARCGDALRALTFTRSAPGAQMVRPKEI